jgi:tripartite ATP-independent transporter DctP family solute receptor
MNLKRRGFYLLATVVVLAGWVGPALGQEQVKNYVMRIAGSPPAGDIRYEALKYMQEEMPKATGGRVKIEAFMGVVGSEREILERLILGTMDAYIGSTGTLQALTGEPLASLYDVPYLFKDWDHLYKVAKSDIGQKLNDKMINRGIRIVDYVSMGNRAVYTRTKPIKTAADLRGQKIRVMENPVYLAMYKEFGAIPVPMAWGEIYTSLQTGAIDGVDGSLSSGLGSKHTESVKYVTFMANHVVIASVITVSERWWKSLPADLRGQIEKVIHDAAAYERKKNDEYQTELKREWEKAGVVFTEPDRTELEKLGRKTYPMVEKSIGSEVIQRVVKMGQ